MGLEAVPVWPYAKVAEVDDSQMSRNDELSQIASADFPDVSKTASGGDGSRSQSCQAKSSSARASTAASACFPKASVARWLLVLLRSALLVTTGGV
jgi:hypothetical protein